MSIDVEPDAFQAPRERERIWPGFADTFERIRALRPVLAAVTGAEPSFGWYVRTDPQIEAVCGRADAAWAWFPERLDAVRAEGDAVGLHIHPIRWSEERGLWVHDLDPEWLVESAESALDAFERATGEPARLVRMGAAILTNELVALFDERGVVAETSLESARGTNSGVPTVGSGCDESPVVGRFTNCSSGPRHAYRPDPDDFLREGGTNARRIALVPVLSGPKRPPAPAWHAALRRIVGHPLKPRSTHVLYPTEDWGDPRRFWDLAMRRVDEMERPYLSIGIRTNAPGCDATRRVARLLAALPSHPLARRLRFTSPLTVLDRILPPAPVPCAAS